MDKALNYAIKTMSNFFLYKRLTIQIQLGGYNMQSAFKLLSGELTGNDRGAIVLITPDMEIFK